MIWQQTPKTIGRGHFGGRLVFASDGKFCITAERATALRAGARTECRSWENDSHQRRWLDCKRQPVREPVGRAARCMEFRTSQSARCGDNPTSGQLWMHEMGPKGGDELNVIQRGGNYGWPIVSEGVHYNDARIPLHSTHPDFVAPLRSWVPVISPSGLMFYTANVFASWRGNALIGGLSSKALIRLALDGNKVIAEERLDMGRRIRDVVQAPDGAILLLTDGAVGELLRLTPSTRGNRAQARDCAKAILANHSKNGLPRIATRRFVRLARGRPGIARRSCACCRTRSSCTALAGRAGAARFRRALTAHTIVRLTLCSGVLP